MNFKANRVRSGIAPARAAFAAAVAEKLAGRFMIRSRPGVVQRAPAGRLVSGNFGTRRHEAATAQRVGRVPDGWRRKRLQSG